MVWVKLNPGSTELQKTVKKKKKDFIFFGKFKSYTISTNSATFTSSVNQAHCPTFDLLRCGSLIHGGGGDCLRSLVVAVTCSSSHTHTHSSKGTPTLARACPCHAQSAANRRPCERKREGGETRVTTGDKDEFRQDTNGHMIRKWITFTTHRRRVPWGLVEIAWSQDLLRFFTVNSRVFKRKLRRTTQRSKSFFCSVCLSPGQVCLQFHRSSSPSWIPQQSGLLLKLISIPNKCSETFSSLNVKVNVI